MSGINQDIQELKRLFEQEEDILFKPASPKELTARRDQIFQRKRGAIQNFADNWKVTALTVNHPLSDTEDYDNRDTGMWAWWRNNKQWKQRGISKIDADWKYITFFFYQPKSKEEATQLVGEFINDWANKPATKDKVLAIGDMVYLRGGDDYDRRWSTDAGRITAIDGEKVRVRFHHYGNADLTADKFVYDKEGNSWDVVLDDEFRVMLTKKKGEPKVGASCLVSVSAAQGGWSRGGHNREFSAYGKIESVENGVATVSFEPHRENWQDPRQVNVSDLYYDWKSKDWRQRGL